MQLNKIFNAEDIEVLFAQWENVTGVKPLLLDSDGSVAIGEGEASEYRDVIKAGIEIVGYLSYAKKEDAEDENEAKAKIAALTIVLTQLAASEEKRMDEEKKNPLNREVFDSNILQKYFPQKTSAREMEMQILQLLEQWSGMKA